jgi:hypothetical protein
LLHQCTGLLLCPTLQWQAATGDYPDRGVSELGREGREPPRFRHRVVIDIRDDLAGTLARAPIPCPAEARLGFKEIPDTPSSGDLPRTPVGGSVVDHQHIKWGVGLPGEGCETPAELLRPVAGANDD